MVIYLKGSDKSQKIVPNDMTNIAKIMINIEFNRVIYDQDGIQVDQNTKFNEYLDNGIQYDIMTNRGFIIICSDNCIDNKFIKQLSNLVIALNHDIPSICIQYLSHQYTLVTQKNTYANNNNKSSSSRYRKIMLHNSMSSKITENKNVYFTWYVIPHIKQNSAFYIPELDSKAPNIDYLLRSPYTIIYDQINLFNMQHGYKQLNYPSLSQYTLYNKNIIMDFIIILEKITGLEYEIYNCLAVDKNYTNADRRYVYTNELDQRLSTACLMHIGSRVGFNLVKPTRVDLTKTWELQIKEPHIYEEQEKNGINDVSNGIPPRPNDICYFGHTPLFGDVIVLTITQTLPDGNQNQFDILVSKSIYHIETGKPSLRRIIRENNMDIICRRITTFPRNTIDVINNLNINPIKKDIMISMERYGCALLPHTYLNQTTDILYITINPDKKQLYLGIKRFTSFEMSCLTNTNTILYRIMTFGSHAKYSENRS